MRGATRSTRRKRGLFLRDDQILSSFRSPQEVEGSYVSTCSFTIDKNCLGVKCITEWKQIEKYNSIQILHYDESRETEKGFLLFFKRKAVEYHIVNRTLHIEGFCELFEKSVWALHSKTDTDFWFEEGAEKLDTPYVLKEFGVEEDADEE